MSDPRSDPFPEPSSLEQEFDRASSAWAGSADEPPLVSPVAGTTGEDASSDDSTADVAMHEAGEVKDTAAGAGREVLETAKSEVGNVADETKRQASGLLDSVTSEVNTQAATQQQKVASSVESLAKELDSMASGSSESGPLTELAQQGAAKGGELARWLQQSEPRDVLRKVQTFARQRPVAFLALCGLAGVVAGRLTRSAVAANTDLDSPSAGSDHLESPRRVSPDELTPDAYVTETSGTDAYSTDTYMADPSDNEPTVSMPARQDPTFGEAR